MSIKAMSWAWEQDVPLTAKFILVTLCDHYNEDEGAAWMSQKTLARRTGYARETINRALKELEEDHRLIESTQRTRDDGGWSSKSYALRRSHG
jgi:DNA-binding MarR family transcriptional regulator